MQLRFPPRAPLTTSIISSSLQCRHTDPQPPGGNRQTGKLPRCLPKVRPPCLACPSSRKLRSAAAATQNDARQIKSANAQPIVFFLPLPMPCPAITRRVGCTEPCQTRVPPPIYLPSTSQTRGDVPSPLPLPSQGGGSCEAVNLPRAPRSAPHPSYRIVACRNKIMHRGRVCRY